MTKNEILVFDWFDGFGTEIQKFTLKDVRILYPHYQLSNLVKHRAVVYIPHSVMDYAMTELYSLGRAWSLCRLLSLLEQIDHL